MTDAWILSEGSELSRKVRRADEAMSEHLAKRS